jgi:hypothetical protein
VRPGEDGRSDKELIPARKSSVMYFCTPAFIRFYAQTDRWNIRDVTYMDDGFWGNEKISLEKSFYYVLLTKSCHKDTVDKTFKKKDTVDKNAGFPLGLCQQDKISLLIISTNNTS